MRNFLKILPLGLVLPMILFGASTPPDVAGSNVSKWLKLAGASDLPAFLVAKSADHWVAIGAIVFAAVYSALVWRVFLRRQTHNLVEQIHHATVQLVGASATGRAGALDFAGTPITLRTEAASRDKSLREGLVYAVTRRWGDKLWDAPAGRISSTGDELEKFHQLARDGKLHVWGKLNAWGVHDPIPAEYWSKHRVRFLSLFNAEADIERDGSPAPHYRDLMVSSADFEREWP